MLVEIGFFFEGNIPVSIFSSAQPDQPFDCIPQIKEEVEHFLHLRRVDGFVIDGLGGNCCTFGSQQYPKEIDCGNPMQGNDLGEDDFNFT